MITIIGVRFRTAGKIYYFDPAGRKIKTGDHVIVETARGIEYGFVVLGSREVDESKVVPPLKAVIRSWLMQAKAGLGEKYGSGRMVAPWVMAAVMASTMPKQWNIGT